MLSCLTGWCTPLGLGWHSSIPRFASFAYWLTVCFHAVDATTTGTWECSHFQICILFQIWDAFLTRARNGCMLKANQWWTLSIDVWRKFTRMHIVLSPVWINFADSLSLHIAISVWILKSCLMWQSADPSQKNTQLILKFLPLMIGYFSLSVPSGLSLYW